VTDVVSAWRKVAGAYAGVGIAADAFRYGALRDEGADCDEVEQARVHVRRSLEALHLAVAITGEQGVIARSFARRDLPGTGPGIETTPLFDADGLPLPTEKDNGTWREDHSGGLYPDVVWEDSCSRDQYVGWVVGFAALWEVIGADPTFPDDVKERLQRDAAVLARALMQVGGQGYDLEIHDADGRVTYHGYLHEEAIERTYLTGFENGFHALMALGIVAGLAYVAEQPDIDAYLQDRLILAGSGHNDELVAEDPLPMRIRPGSNYHWRSNPYRVNGGGDGSRLLSGVDFRIAYWMARWMRRSPP